MKKDFPKKEAETLIKWMKEQMYGETVTEWTYGNEHDRMADCKSFLESLVFSANCKGDGHCKDCPHIDDCEA